MCVCVVGAWRMDVIFIYNYKGKKKLLVVGMMMSSTLEYNGVDFKEGELKGMLRVNGGWAGLLRWCIVVYCSDVVVSWVMLYWSMLYHLVNADSNSVFHPICKSTE